MASQRWIAEHAHKWKRPLSVATGNPKSAFQDDGLLALAPKEFVLRGSLPVLASDELVSRDGLPALEPDGSLTADGWIGFDGRPVLP